ncbi:ROK family transcriptional regulator [Streptomyces tirandamycinicus]|uniref:Transcriptional regulator n=1 Tax=Streptomyces tirandamycinicus TaxID=2174846 RepID=A0A2S1SRM9_9ACTN|nr:ROK family transcriptional regulator [Streptomyces tirandamycinicus]AWI28967.1 transcriptional regulator [Streptomyces tirandamycinicus]
MLRSHNAALVLDLLRAAGGDGISRLELAERTGLTPQAVSKITGRLRKDGMATEAGRRASTGGKPRTVLRLVPSAAHAVGLHLDRDELTAVLVDLAGTVVASRSRALDLGGPVPHAISAAAGEVRALLAVGPERVLGVGVGMPGPLDHRTGVPGRVTGAPGWAGVPLRDELAERLGVPVVLDKDTNAAVLGLALRGLPRTGPGAESAADPGHGVAGPAGGRADGDPASPAAPACPGSLTSPASPGSLTSLASPAHSAAAAAAPGSFAYLHLGTGLGAGLVIGGVVHRGARTGAGEFGHQVVQLDGPVCPCGNRGCIEALCLAAVARGEFGEAARVLGTGAANLVRLLDVEQVLLGGRTVLAAAETFVRGVGEVIGDDAVHVALAESGAYPVAEGAAQLVLAPLFGRMEAMDSANRA